MSPDGNPAQYQLQISRSLLSSDQCLARPLLTQQHGGEACVSLLKSALVMVVSQLSCSFRLWLLDNINLTDVLMTFKLTLQSASIWTVTHFLLFWLHFSIKFEISQPRLKC